MPQETKIVKGGFRATLALIISIIALILAIMVVVARMLVGFLLGAIAGWLNGRWFDRVVMGAAETIATFPTLLLAMILVLAIGIRQGMRPFVIALCFEVSTTSFSGSFVCSS